MIKNAGQVKHVVLRRGECLVGPGQGGVNRGCFGACLHRSHRGRIPSRPSGLPVPDPTT